MGFLDGELLARFAGVLAIDLILSGDNAVVIALAVRQLEGKARRRAICFGAGGAVAPGVRPRAHHPPDNLGHNAPQPPDGPLLVTGLRRGGRPRLRRRGDDLRGPDHPRLRRRSAEGSGNPRSACPHGRLRGLCPVAACEAALIRRLLGRVIGGVYEKVLRRAGRPALSVPQVSGSGVAR